MSDFEVFKFQKKMLVFRIYSIVQYKWRIFAVQLRSEAGVLWFGSAEETTTLTKDCKRS